MAEKNKPQVLRPTKTSEPVSRVDASKGAPVLTQFAAFEAAMKLFHARQFSEARAMFQQAGTGAGSDVAQRARLHIAMCDRRLQQPAVSFATAEEYYNYGIALLNARNVVEARTNLEKA